MPSKLAPPRRRYGWNPVAKRFVDRLTGRFVSLDDARSALDDVLRVSERVTRDASERFRAGQITIAEWQAIIRDEIKLTHLHSLALSQGGWDQLTQADYGRAGAAIRKQYRYLDRFTEALRNGLPTDGSFLVRADMYAKAARPFYHELNTEVMRAAGMTEERNVLHPAEHCAGCIDMSALGWVSIGTCVPIGQRPCRGNDRCTMRYR